jgi:succinyl-diaminopimelate desuccinylase
MKSRTQLPPQEAIDAAVRSLAPQIPTLLGRLVGHATVNPPGLGYDEITRLLVKELEDSGAKAKRLTPSKKLQQQVLPEDQRKLLRHNVLGKIKVPGAHKTVHFNAHYDVVPVGGQWRHGDPFSGKVEKGWIYGRGTADMKGSMASLFTALRALAKAGIKPNVNVEVSFTADEETDSLLGSGWLVENAPLDADAAIVMEGAEGDQICCGHNGVVWLEVEVLGKAAHGSRPDMGINALEKMAALVQALGHYKVLLKNEPFRSPDGSLLYPTINVGGVFEQGPGGKINTVPSLARFSIDRRVVPNETVAGVECEMREILEAAARSIPDCRIIIKKVSDNHPCYSEPTDPVFEALAESIRTVRGKKVQYTVSTGFTDMHFFSHHLGIPTLGYGPGGEGEHAVDERARLKDLEDCARIYAHLLANFED